MSLTLPVSLSLHFFLPVALISSVAAPGVTALLIVATAAALTCSAGEASKVEAMKSRPSRLPAGSLAPEQSRLLERTYTRFHRSGAGLDEAAKKRMAEINERLAHLGTAFSHHLLGDEQDWFMELGEDDRAGLPEAFVAAAKATAEERGMEGKAIVTLSRCGSG